MSKSLASVLETVAVVGLQFVPGVGQAVAGVLGITGAAAARIGLGIATVGLIGAEAGLNALLGNTTPEQSQTAIKSPRPERVTAYGTSRLTPMFLV